MSKRYAFILYMDDGGNRLTRGIALSEEDAKRWWNENYMKHKGHHSTWEWPGYERAELISYEALTPRKMLRQLRAIYSGKAAIKDITFVDLEDGVKKLLSAWTKELRSTEIVVEADDQP